MVPEGWRGPGGSLPASIQTVAQLKCLQLLSGIATSSNSNVNVSPMVKKRTELCKLFTVLDHKGTVLWGLSLLILGLMILPHHQFSVEDFWFEARNGDEISL